MVAGAARYKSYRSYGDLLGCFHVMFCRVLLCTSVFSSTYIFLFLFLSETAKNHTSTRQCSLVSDVEFLGPIRGPVVLSKYGDDPEVYTIKRTRGGRAGEYSYSSVVACESDVKLDLTRSVELVNFFPCIS